MRENGEERIPRDPTPSIVTSDNSAVCCRIGAGELIATYLFRQLSVGVIYHNTCRGCLLTFPLTI
jgi:hypothetical protein